MRWVKAFPGLGLCGVCKGPAVAALLRCQRHAQPRLACHWCPSSLRTHRHSRTPHLLCSRVHSARRQPRRGRVFAVSRLWKCVRVGLRCR